MNFILIWDYSSWLDYLSLHSSDVDDDLPSLVLQYSGTSAIRQWMEGVAQNRSSSNSKIKVLKLDSVYMLKLPFNMDTSGSIA